MALPDGELRRQNHAPTQAPTHLQQAIPCSVCTGEEEWWEQAPKIGNTKPCGEAFTAQPAVFAAFFFVLSCISPHPHPRLLSPLLSPPPPHSWCQLNIVECFLSLLSTRKLQLWSHG